MHFMIITYNAMFGQTKCCVWKIMSEMKLLLQILIRVSISNLSYNKSIGCNSFIGIQLTVRDY